MNQPAFPAYVLAQTPATLRHWAMENRTMAREIHIRYMPFFNQDVLRFEGYAQELEALAAGKEVKL